MDNNTQEKLANIMSKKIPPESDPTKIGAESVHDGRPSTDDNVVEAILQQVNRYRAETLGDNLND